LLKKNEEGRLVTPKRKELADIAEKLAKKNGSSKADELSKLTKQKAFVEGVPYAFSLIFMGLSLSAITRFWTQYRYNHTISAKANNNQAVFVGSKTPNIFKEMNIIKRPSSQN
ncbi:MAG: hypothetical protein IKP71_00910, partial [Candidatus Riflebacteria bacterium]|nr:hypothetical protein [Candidatus Riflebacteria bacterium]